MDGNKVLAAFETDCVDGLPLLLGVRPEGEKSLSLFMPPFSVVPRFFASLHSIQRVIPFSMEDGAEPRQTYMIAMAEQVSCEPVPQVIMSNEQSTDTAPESSTNLYLKKCLSGLLHVIRSMEQRSYIIPQYPTYCVELLHVVVEDKGTEYDSFLEIKHDRQIPEFPGEVYVNTGFFLRVCYMYKAMLKKQHFF